MKLEQPQIPEIERMKVENPIAYEALRKLEAVIIQHGEVLNDAIGDNALATVPPQGYQPVGVLYFSNADHINSVPPPPDVNSDPDTPNPPNPETPNPRMRVIAASRRQRGVTVKFR